MGLANSREGLDEMVKRDRVVDMIVIGSFP